MDLIAWITILAVALLAATVTVAVWRTLSRNPASDSFDQALAKMTGTETFDNDLSLNKSDAKKSSWSWNKYWLEAFLKSGRRVADPAAPGRLALAVAIVGLAFGALVWPGPLFCGVTGFVALAGLQLWLSGQKGKRETALERQLPLLLSSLRNQMQAGMTVQGAILAVADDLPYPLGEEMRLVKADVNVSVPLEQAMNNLADRTQSKLMQFLVSSVGVAIRSGSDLIPQLIVIEETVRQRSRIQGKIRSALALAKPTAVLAAGAPVALGGWLLITDPSYSAFYMTPIGLAMLLGVGLLYGAGLVVMRIMVSNVEKV